MKSDYENLDNEHLAVLAKTDREARNLLFGRTYKICYMHTKKYWKYINDSALDVEDLLQESFFGFNKAIQSFDINKGIKFNTFISRNVWNTIQDQMHIRHNKNLKPTTRNESFEQTVELYGYDLIGMPCRKIEEVEDKIFCEQMKEGLTEKESLVFDEFFCNRKSLREIGRRLGVSGEAISYTWKKTLKKLERKIQL